LYSSLALSRLMPLRVLQSLSSSTICSHMQLGTPTVCTKKVSSRERVPRGLVWAYARARAYLVRMATGALQRQSREVAQVGRCVSP
jgi:hypothetical protein